MIIYVDADGCPVVDLSVKIAKEYNLQIIVVKNYAHNIYHDYATIISVDIHKDSADFYIVNQIKKNDIVITQDYGLASMCLSKGALPINQNGIVFSQKNIDGLLNRRHLHQELRKQKKYYSKTKKRSPEEDKYFEEAFRNLLNKLL